MTTVAATATCTTIVIANTYAPWMRIEAKRDIPEYGIVAGEVVYLVRTSANDGTYDVVKFVGSSWACPCEGNATYRRNCKHCKTASLQSRLRAARLGLQAAPVEVAKATKKPVAKSGRSAKKAATAKPSTAKVAAEADALQAFALSLPAIRPTHVATHKARLAPEQLGQDREHGVVLRE